MTAETVSREENTDAELLRRYVAERAQEAFAELVRRRVDLVYSVALRQCGGDRHLAEDVTQKVFSDLARKAAELSQRAVVSGWLCRSAQFAASDVVRAERRRRTREQESQAMNETGYASGAEADWEKMRPLLDEALGELSEDDRDAVALRFFEGRAFADVGRALRLTEEAARKRVERALNKLAGVLSRRGITSSSAALGVALTNQATVAAPAGLATTISGAALAGAAAAGVGVAGTALIVFMSSTKVTIGFGAAAILAVGAAYYQSGEAKRRGAELAALGEKHALLQTQFGDIERRLKSAETRARAADADSGKLLDAVEAAKAGMTASATAATQAAAQPITGDAVEARYKRAQELARNGNSTEALKEYLWCFDEGMSRVAAYTGVRLSFLLGEIEKIGPAGIAALRERRDRAQKRMLAGEKDFEAAMDFAALNGTLKEDDLTIAIYDQLAPGDERRRTLAMSAYEQLVAARRYADAAQARSYAQMASMFEMMQGPTLTANTPDPAGMRQMQRESAIESASESIEVLAGAGDLAN
ncbi:MAG: sigma-70 family RNA polymerase sigma factor, partial [Opitutaceae bacterium]